MEERPAETPAAHSQPTRYAFLGPHGTFCQAALLQVCDEGPGVEHIPALDVSRALAMADRGEVDYAVVPIENSVEGGINATLDSLAATQHLKILGEVLVPITFALCVRPGVRLADVRRISTHQAAWAQCRNWIADHCPQAIHIPATSTAAAAQMLASDVENPGFDAALVSPLSARHYGLTILSDDVADNANAVTRFILVGRGADIPQRTGADKTTLMVQLPHNESGALLTMLEQFAARGVNLSRIESRPVGDALGRYAFSIDAEGHIDDERIQAVLQGLHRTCPKVVFFGSYPNASGAKVKARPGTSDDDYRSGREWLRSLFEGGR